MLRALEAFLLDQWDTLALTLARPPRLSFVLMDDSDYERGAIGVLAFCEGVRRPVLFAKVARDPEHDEHVGRQFEVLTALRERGDTWVRNALARPLFLRRIQGELVMAESAFLGPLMVDEMCHWRRGGFRRGVVADHFRAMVGWLVRLSRATGVRRPLTREDLDTHVFSHLRAVYREGDWPSAVAQFRARLEALVGRTVLMVPVHNDLNPKNIILEERAPPRVVDWEVASLEGLPFLDLFYFTTWYVFRHRRVRPRDERRRFHYAYWKCGWYVELVNRAATDYATALGLETELAEALFPLHLLERAGRDARRGRAKQSLLRRAHFEKALARSVRGGSNLWA